MIYIPNDLIYSHPRKYESLSRYQIYRQIVDNESDCLRTETFNETQIKGSNEKYHLVEVSEANRLDIISQLHYGTPTLYWAIAIANSLVNPFIINPGTILIIPDISVLYTYGGPLYRRV